MKRDEALADFSRDHLPALRQAKHMKEAGTDEGELDPAEAADEFLTFWEEEAALHFREEEDVILPILSRRGPVTEHEDIRRMLDDHAWFRDQVPKLRQSLDNGGEVTELVHEIGRRLETHARMEEQEIFEFLQETLDEGELEALHERSVQFRERWRPDSIGPRQS